jgi:hypothetical protein
MLGFVAQLYQSLLDLIPQFYQSLLGFVPQLNLALCKNYHN